MYLVCLHVHQLPPPPLPLMDTTRIPALQSVLPLGAPLQAPDLPRVSMRWRNLCVAIVSLRCSDAASDAGTLCVDPAHAWRSNVPTHAWRSVRRRAAPSLAFGALAVTSRSTAHVRLTPPGRHPLLPHA